MLLQIFNAPIMPGAQTFLLIVAILIGLGAGISAIDVRKTFVKDKEEPSKRH
jgi:F0F1-type ATP synthase assembly protein I